MFPSICHLETRMEKEIGGVGEIHHVVHILYGRVLFLFTLTLYLLANVCIDFVSLSVRCLEWVRGALSVVK